VIIWNSESLLTILRNDSTLSSDCRQFLSLSWNDENIPPSLQLSLLHRASVALNEVLLFNELLFLHKAHTRTLRSIFHHFYRSTKPKFSTCRSACSSQVLLKYSLFKLFPITAAIYEIEMACEYFLLRYFLAHGVSTSSWYHHINQTLLDISQTLQIPFFVSES